MPLSLLRGRGCSWICQLSRLQRGCRRELASMMVASVLARPLADAIWLIESPFGCSKLK